MTDAKLEDCPGPDCDGRVKRLLGTGAGLIFKGSGFYQTDYRSASYQAAAKAESSGASSGGEGGAKLAESKPAAAPASPAAPAAAN